MIVERKNFSGQQTPSVIAAEYRGCNFSQPKPESGPVGVRLFPGDDTPRTFIECNLVNACPPPGSTLVNCNTTLRESQVEVGTETVEVGGREVEIKRYADQIFGRTNPETLEPDLKARPLEIDADPPDGSLDAKVRELVRERDRAESERVAKEAEAVEEAKDLPTRVGEVSP